MKIVYEHEKQTDPVLLKLPPGEVRYGLSVIRWVSGEAVGEAHWKDRDPSAGCDRKVDVLVFGGRSLEDRIAKSIFVKLRPKQKEFRDALRVLDKQCVLTGEKCPTALEAAHLIPVARNGLERIENGILLRADLHLLLDAGLIWFDVSESQAAVKCVREGLTDNYLTSLNRKLLPDETFRRVKVALLQRASLPGGRGRDDAGQSS